MALMHCYNLGAVVDSMGVAGPLDVYPGVDHWISKTLDSSVFSQPKSIFFFKIS